MSRGIHTSPVRGATDEWITPPWLTELLGPFDLDPCASVTQPWPHAAKSYTIIENGLMQEWRGRIWLNPPYGPDAAVFMDRLAAHGDGIALVAARVETGWFHKSVWHGASAVGFPRGRFTFFRPDGELPDRSKGSGNSGHSSVLVAYGRECRRKLHEVALDRRLMMKVIDL